MSKSNLMKFILFSCLLMLTTLLAVTAIAKPPKREINAAKVKEPLTIHPNYIAYHNSELTTQIYFSVNSNELLYMHFKAEEKKSVARVKILYKLYPGYGSTQVLDSATVFFTDTAITDNNPDELIRGNFEIKINYNSAYVAEIVMSDVNRNNESFTYLMLDKKNNSTHQNYLVSVTNSNQPLFTNYVTNNDSVTIRYDKQIGLKKLIVNYFKHEFPLPPPPFSYQERKPISTIADSIFTITLDDNYESKISLNSKGIYYFVSDTNSKSGCTIIKYNHQLSIIDDAQFMIKTLRYITTKQEYDELLASNNIKLALDKYWLSCASNNKDKARTLIKNYYSRVEKCNSFFTSFDEGWKTDRGLIYLIFGAPNFVSRDNYIEKWIYGEENSPSNQIEFVFTKTENPFSDNDYVLSRSENYKEMWYRNVDAWRMGRVINEK